PVWFAPGLWPWLMLVFAVPLAALTAHRFGRLLTDHRVSRMVWALGYGLLAVVCGAVAQGRLGTVVALVLLPVLANVVTQLIAQPSWTRAAQVGWWLAVIVVFAPVALWIALLALIGVLAVLRARPSRQLL